MTEIRGQALAHLNVPPAVAWHHTCLPANPLTTDHLRVHPPMGAASPIALAPEAGEIWDGHLHVLDEDEIEHERHYRISARSGRQRATATILVRLDPSTDRDTSVTVTCRVRSTGAQGLSPDWLADQWLGAIQAASTRWSAETGLPGVAQPASAADATDPAARASRPWLRPAAGFAAGLATGSALRLAARLATRERSRS